MPYKLYNTVPKYYAGFAQDWVINNSGYPRDITVGGKIYTVKSADEVNKIKQKYAEDKDAKIKQAEQEKASHTQYLQNEKIRKAQARVEPIPELTLHVRSPFPLQRYRRT